MKPERETRTWWGGKSRKQHKRCYIRQNILCFHPSLLCYCHQKGKNSPRRRMRQSQKERGGGGRKWTCVFGEFLSAKNNIWNGFCLWWQQKQQETWETKPWLDVIWIYSREENSSPPRQQPCISHVQTHFHDISVSLSAKKNTCSKWNTYFVFDSNTIFSWKMTNFNQKQVLWNAVRRHGWPLYPSF